MKYRRGKLYDKLREACLRNGCNDVTSGASIAGHRNTRRKIRRHVRRLMLADAMEFEPQEESL